MNNQKQRDREEFENSLDKQWLKIEHGIDFEWNTASKNPDMHRYKNSTAWFMFQTWQAAQASLRKQLEEAMEKDGIEVGRVFEIHYPATYAVIKGGV